MKTMGKGIHATAILDGDVTLGSDVEIGPFAVVFGPATIESGTVLGPHVVVYPNTRIGQQCRLHAGAVVGDLPQDLAFDGAPSFVIIGGHTVLREGATVHRGTAANSTTQIGSHCLLMAHAHVGHDASVGDGTILCNGALIAGHVDVGPQVFVSGNAVVHQFTRIGRLAMLGGGCAASQDIPPFTTARPVATNRLLGLNLVGLKRAGVAAADRAALKEAFSILTSQQPLVRKVTRLREEIDTPLAHEMATFLSTSRRGVCMRRDGRS